MILFQLIFMTKRPQIVPIISTGTQYHFDVIVLDVYVSTPNPNKPHYEDHMRQVLEKEILPLYPPK